MHSNVSYLESNSSFLCCEDINRNKPPKKGNCRSVVPTVLGLLTGNIEQEEVAESSDKAIASSQEYSRDISNMDENSFISCGPGRNSNKYPFASSVHGKSHRTEDIFIREDEDGKRSHYCPLDSRLDSVEDAYSDLPLKSEFDTNGMIGSCNLSSDDIPYLFAEKPPFVESEENLRSSSVDSCTSMIYAPLKNRHELDESSSLEFLVPPKGISTPRKLDKKTMKAWANDSSDEEYYLKNDEKCGIWIVKEPKLNSYRSIVGDYSDMEEFEETSSEEEKANKHQKAPENKKEENGKDDGKNENVSNLNTPTETENKTEKSESDSLNNSTFQQNDDQEQFDSLKIEIENVISKVFDMKIDIESEHKLINFIQDTTKDKNESRVVSDINISQSEISQAFTLQQDADHADNTAKENTKYSNCDEIINYSLEISNSARENDGLQTISEAFDANDQPDAAIARLKNKEIQDNLNMEPVPMKVSEFSIKDETQPDVAMALCYMSDCPTIDKGELDCDTLSDIESVTEKKPTIMTIDLQKIKKQELAGLAMFKTASKSSIFEQVLEGLPVPKTASKSSIFEQEQAGLPVSKTASKSSIFDQELAPLPVSKTASESNSFEQDLTEGKRTATKPPNKFVKLFRNLRKRFEKNKKV